MKLLNIVGLVFVVLVKSEETAWGASELKTLGNRDIADTDLKLVFTIFRHGDRTPDQEELDLYPATEKLDKNIFFPYGMKALTNKGKQRGYSVGKYLRKRYDGFLSRLYLPDQVKVRTTNYARTQMTALTALAALYPPTPSQRWNPTLDWQPVPYDTPDFEEDDLLYWYNCPVYLQKRNEAYKEQEIQDWLKPYKDLFTYLGQKTNTNITTAEDVFYLDNLFQTLSNVRVSPPKWAVEVMPQIQEVTKIEYAAEFYTTELIKLASGVLMNDILNYSSNFIAGDKEQPILRLYSAHENNVAALMAATKVFMPHQPSYGSTFSLELRQSRTTGNYSIAAVYAKDAGGPAKILSVAGCGGGLLCDYDKFVSLVKDNTWSKEDFYKQCGISI